MEEEFNESMERAVMSFQKILWFKLLNCNFVGLWIRFGVLVMGLLGLDWRVKYGDGLTLFD